MAEKISNFSEKTLEIYSFKVYSTERDMGASMIWIIA